MPAPRPTLFAMTVSDTDTSEITVTLVSFPYPPLSAQIASEKVPFGRVASITRSYTCATGGGGGDDASQRASSSR